MPRGARSGQARPCRGRAGCRSERRRSLAAVRPSEERVTGISVVGSSFADHSRRTRVALEGLGTCGANGTPRPAAVTPRKNGVPAARPARRHEHAPASQRGESSPRRQPRMHPSQRAVAHPSSADLRDVGRVPAHRVNGASRSRFLRRRSDTPASWAARAAKPGPREVGRGRGRGGIPEHWRGAPTPSASRRELGGIPRLAARRGRNRSDHLICGAARPPVSVVAPEWSVYTAVNATQSRHLVRPCGLGSTLDWRHPSPLAAPKATEVRHSVRCGQPTRSEVTGGPLRPR